MSCIRCRANQSEDEGTGRLGLPERILGRVHVCATGRRRDPLHSERGREYPAKSGKMKRFDWKRLFWLLVKAGIWVLAPILAGRGAVRALKYAGVDGEAPEGVEVLWGIIGAASLLALLLFAAILTLGLPLMRAIVGHL